MSAPDEAEEWGRRMIRFEEEVDYLATEAEWRAFVATKIRLQRGYRATEEQLRGLELARKMFIQTIRARPERDPRRIPPIRYRDLDTGLWIKKPEFLERVRGVVRRLLG